MNLGLVADAPLAIKIHLATVIPAFFIGTWLIFFSTKGARRHRILGLVYLVLMAVTAVTTLFIRTLYPGRFSFVHLFIPLTLFGIFGAIRGIRRKDIRAHRRATIMLYAGALLIAGAFTFLPGRMMYEIFFR
jgi:uncharacterized membrane protein